MVPLMHSQLLPSSTLERGFGYLPPVFQSAYLKGKWCSSPPYASPLSLNDPRVISVGRVLGLQAEECFSKEEEGSDGQF
jgi:hypothetical protein